MRHFLVHLVQQYPELFRDEMAARFRTVYRMDIPVPTISRILREEGVTRCRLSPMSARRGDVDVIDRVAAFREEMDTWDGRDVMWLDESGVCRKMGANRKYGRGAAGDRLHVLQPYGRGGNMSLQCMVGFRRTRRGWGMVRAAAVQRGGVKRPDLVRFLRNQCKPYARKGAILVLDNASIHKGEEVRRVVEEEMGMRLVFLPPYSPHLNPIECVFGKMKAMLRRHWYWSHAKRGKLIDEKAVVAALRMVEVKDLEGYATDDGYVLRT